MRIFLLPISTRRTLLYCERVASVPAPGQSQPYTERIIAKATTTWAGWEKAEKGWQKRLTGYGNQLFKRIPYQEWGLKSFPPATKVRLAEVDAAREGDAGPGPGPGYECLYPGAFMKGRSVTDLLTQLATERQAFHRRGMITSMVWMPITVPFALVPVIPNIPFFWFAFRAYSHYRALAGGRFLHHLLRRNLVRPTDSKVMDGLYAAGLLHPTREAARAATGTPPSEEEMAWIVAQVEAEAKGGGEGGGGGAVGEGGGVEGGGGEEVLLLRPWSGQVIAEAFGLAEMRVEIERAVEQVEKAVSVEREARAVGQARMLEEGTGEKTARPVATRAKAGEMEQDAKR
ncbi:hypothetical protein LTR53_001375 [Teratosphaeriaceae sp. CCFEE 6253]|nr:hypothetical protein LTR53_001375 [Teratosphaeriaceae sp. CCFEE 6253]